MLTWEQRCRFLDNDIDIVVANPVDKTKLGDYTVTYNASDDAVMHDRVIKKSDRDDSTAPIIVLTGDAELNHEGGLNTRIPEQPVYNLIPRWNRCRKSSRLRRA